MILATLLLLADLEIASVIPVKDTLTTDETFTVAVQVRNRGSEEAKDVKVTVGVNALSFMQGMTAPDGWTCETGPLYAYALSCATPSLAPESEADFTMTMASPQHSAMTYRIRGRVQSSTQDDNETNDTREVRISTVATKTNADLSLTATSEANQMKVEVRNLGPQDAREIMVVLNEANGLPLTASGRGWKCSGAICTRPLLKIGATATLKVSTAAPAPGAKATISARVRAESNRESAKNNAAKLTLP